MLTPTSHDELHFLNNRLYHRKSAFQNRLEASSRGNIISTVSVRFIT